MSWILTSASSAELDEPRLPLARGRRTDYTDLFRTDVDLDKARVDRLEKVSTPSVYYRSHLVELAETADEAHRALADLLVRVWERAARELAKEANE